MQSLIDMAAMKVVKDTATKAIKDLRVVKNTAKKAMKP